jgi:hypothetical protein
VLRIVSSGSSRISGSLGLKESAAYSEFWKAKVHVISRIEDILLIIDNGA